MTFLNWQLASPLAASVALVLGCLVLGWMRWRYGPIRLRSIRRAAATTGLVLGVLCFALVAGDLREAQTIERRAILVVVDQSASDQANASARALELWKGLRTSLRAEDRLALATFAKSVQPVLPFASPLEQPEVPLIPRPTEADGHLWSRPELALRYASLAFPTDYRVQTLLVSDGGGGEQLPPMSNLVSLAQVEAQNLEDVGLDGILVSRIGSELSVQCEAFASRACDATLRLSLDGVEQDVFEYHLSRGVTPIRRTLTSTLTTDAELQLVIESAADGLKGNEELRVFVPYPDGRRRVTIVDGSEHTSASGALMQALASADFDVTLATPTQFEAGIAALDGVDGVIFVDLMADAIQLSTQEVVRDWVRAGGGVAMVGGPQAFALGGWTGTPIEAVLPVNCQPKDDDRPAMSIAIILDSSGSMGEEVGKGTKLDQANLGAELSLRLVRDKDFFGVAQSTDGNDWIVPIQPLQDRKAAIAAIRRNSVGGGGINVSSALKDAYPQLARTAAKDRMIVLFGDGNDSYLDDGGDDGGVDEWVARVRREYEENKTRLSVIAVGNGKDVPMLRQLAEAGRGTFVLTEDATTLPILFSRSSAAFLGGFVVEEPMSVSVTKTHELLEDLPFDRAPNIDGSIRFEAKPGAETLLEAQGEFTLPLLVAKQQVAGRSLAFASDLGSTWLQTWLGWPSYSAAWQRWTRWLTQGRHGAIADAEIGFADGRASVELFHDAELKGRVFCQLRGPSGAGSTHGSIKELERVTKQSSRLLADLDEAGTWRLTFWAQDGDNVRVLGSSWLTWSLLNESRPHASALGHMTKTAQESGGGRVSSAGDVINQLPKPRVRYEPAIHLLSMMMLSALMLLLMARRFPAILGRATSEKLVEAEGTLSRLSDARRDEVRRREQVLEREARLRTLSAPLPTPETPNKAGLDANRLLEAKRRAKEGGRGNE